MSYTDFIERVLHDAASIAKGYFGKVSGVTKPGDNNQVLTEADIAVGRYLVDAVRMTFPDHNVIDEEAGIVDMRSRYTWVIDPIEATSNFAAGLPQYGIMIGLLEDDKPIAGGIVAPAYDKLYIAEKGKGATCNGEPMQVSSEVDLSKMLFSYSMDGHRENPQFTRDECQQLANIVLSVRNVRSNGCEAIDSMYVAEGRYAGRVIQTSKIWDCVAPHIICEEAGAVYSLVTGEPVDYRDPLTKTDTNYAICITAPQFHDEVVRLLRD